MPESSESDESEEIVQGDSISETDILEIEEVDEDDKEVREVAKAGGSVIRKKSHVRKVVIQISIQIRGQTDHSGSLGLVRKLF